MSWLYRGKHGFNGVRLEAGDHGARAGVKVEEALLVEVLDEATVTLVEDLIERNPAGHQKAAAGPNWSRMAPWRRHWKQQDIFQVESAASAIAVRARIMSYEANYECQLCLD